MTHLWNMIEVHYILAAIVVTIIVGELSKVIRSFLHIFHKTNIHNHFNSRREDTQQEVLRAADTLSRVQASSRPGASQRPTVLSRFERVLRNARGGDP